MTSLNNASKGSDWLAKLKVHHTNHPIVFGYAILVAGASIVMYMNWRKLDWDKMCVKKYRRDYIVMRPDDLAVHMIKTGKTGLDN